MATAMNMEEFVNCDICFEPYDKPQMLPCMHTYCLKCVDKIKHQHYTECPVCKKRCRTEDIKLDFRTAALVESYHKKKEKDDRVITCESCERSSNVSHKCETCDLMLCQRCEASHTVIADSHLVRTIPSVAAEIKAEIEQVANHLQQQEQILSTRLASRQTKLEGMRKTCDDAMVKINEHEENLIRKIKCHHDGLRQQVDKEKKKCIKKSKQEFKEVEVHRDTVKDKQVLLNSWLNTRSDVSLASTAQVVRGKLQQAVTEATTEREMEFKVDVIAGQDYDVMQSTKVVIRDADGDRAGEGMGLTPTDFTSAAYRDYKAEKSISFNSIRGLQEYNNHLYTTGDGKIHIYTKDFTLIRTITYKFNHRGNFIIQDKYFIIANEDGENMGLLLLDAEGKLLQVICPGHFLGVHLFDHKIYAYVMHLNKVFIFEQTPDYLWKQTGYLYLNYYGNEKPDYYTIQSFSLKNNQIYVTDNASLYHMDLKGRLLRKVSCGADMKKFEEPYISGVDSKGNVLLVEQKHRRIVLVHRDSQCSVLRLRGEQKYLSNYVLMGDDNECIWVAHFSYCVGDSNTSCLVKYKTVHVSTKVI